MIMHWWRWLSSAIWPMRSLGGIGEIRALGGLGAVGDDEQPRQPHRVIDAQHAGMAHVGAVERGEAPPALARARDRIGRRQVPDLAVGGERIGRRADAGSDGKFVGARPALRAVGRGADREVAIKAHLQPARLRAGRRAVQLPVGEKLAEQREADIVGALARAFASSASASAARKASGQRRQSSPLRSPEIASKIANRRNASPPSATKRIEFCEQRIARPRCARARSKAARRACSAARLSAQTAS